MIPLIYLDTNVFIAAFEAAGPGCLDAWTILSAAEAGDMELVTSELTLAELLSKPPLDNPELVSRYPALIETRPGLRVPSIDRALLLRAAAIRRTHAGVKLPDAIHLATVLSAGCSHMISGDLRLPQQRSLTIVRFGPRTIEEIRNTSA